MLTLHYHVMVAVVSRPDYGEKQRELEIRDNKGKLGVSLQRIVKRLN